VVPRVYRNVSLLDVSELPESLTVECLACRCEPWTMSKATTSSQSSVNRLLSVGRRRSLLVLHTLLHSSAPPLLRTAVCRYEFCMVDDNGMRASISAHEFRGWLCDSHASLQIAVCLSVSVLSVASCRQLVLAGQDISITHCRNVFT